MLAAELLVEPREQGELVEHTALDAMIDKIRGGDGKSWKPQLRIALENTAGQGTCLGSEIRHLAAIYDAVKKPERLAVCLDTAHFFAAGYDIRTAKGWNSAIGEVDALIGADQIVAFHLNDSKTDLGSHVDRHAGIGQGKIGRDAFRHIVNDPRFRNHPGCLEAPKSEDLHEDVENLAILRSLVKEMRGRLN